MESMQLARLKEAAASQLQLTVTMAYENVRMWAWCYKMV